MRLAIVESGHRGPVKIALALVQALMGYKPDVMRIMMYRPAFVGLEFGRINRRAIMGSTSWARVELELLGALVSSLNQCTF